MASAHSSRPLALPTRPPFGLLLARLLTSAGEALMAYCAGKIVSSLLNPAGGARAFDWALIALGAALVKGGARVTSAMGEMAFRQRWLGQVRQRVAAVLLAGQEANADEMMGIFASFDALAQGGPLARVQLTFAALQVCLVALALGVVHWRLALLALVVIVPFAILLSRWRRFVRSHAEGALAAASHLQGLLNGLVRNATVWRSYGIGDRVMGGVSERSQGLIAALRRREGWRVGQSASNEVLAALAVICILAGLGQGWVATSPRKLVAFLTMFFLLYRPLRQLADARGELTVAKAALARLRPFLRMPATEAKGVKPAAMPCSRLEGGWRLELQEFGHGQQHQRVTGQLRPGQLLLIRGKNGVGKTRWLRALVGVDASAGQRRLENGSGEEILSSAGPWPGVFAWVPQEMDLLPLTLEDNLRWLAPEGAEVAKLWDALQRLGAPPVGLGERIGPGGRVLSAGEQEWVNLARALASEAAILVLDEPTAHLTAAATARFESAVRELSAERALVVVSHRQGWQSHATRTVTLSECDSEGLPGGPDDRSSPNGARASAFG